MAAFSLWSILTKLFSSFFSLASRADSCGLLQMAGSVSLASIAFICSVFWGISKKPPKVGGFFLQFTEKVFDLCQFHALIVNAFSLAVKTKAPPTRPRSNGWVYPKKQ